MPDENRILAALPPAVHARVLQQSRVVSFCFGDVVYKPRGPIAKVYFPRSCVLSKIQTMLDGRAAEVTMIGREGVCGIATLFGATTSSLKAICQIPVDALEMTPAAFVAEVDRSPQLKRMVFNFTRYLMDSVAMLSACNCLHTVEERCARWIFMSHDRALADSFPLTQEFLAIMLGVRRSSVSVAAGTLAKAGLITYHHDRMTVLERGKLEDAACECYEAIRANSESMYRD